MYTEELTEKQVKTKNKNLKNLKELKKARKARKSKRYGGIIYNQKNLQCSVDTTQYS